MKALKVRYIEAHGIIDENAAFDIRSMCRAAIKRDCQWFIINLEDAHLGDDRTVQALKAACMMLRQRKGDIKLVGVQSYTRCRIILADCWGYFDLCATVEEADARCAAGLTKTP